MKKLAVISLGCDKNRVDTETMLSYLGRDGFSVTDDFDEAEIIIVNTCAFIESARQEAVDTILAAAGKKAGKCEKLIVTGCLPQKYAAELTEELPEVDAFLGTNNYSEIGSIIRNLYDDKERVRIVSTDPCDNPALCAPRIVTTPSHYAYLKIADGCDNHCTFCTIPSIRGKYVSKDMDALIQEAETLVSGYGVKELILVAQDVTRYGKDRYGDYELVELIRRLSALDLDWIRLMYCYPELVSDELIAEIAENPKVAKYIDIPVQHSDDEVLRRMNRRSTGTGIRALFSKIRHAAPEIAIRTTVMVGFPGETERNFENLCAFIAEYKPDHVGVFAYSKEDDTPSARLSGEVSDEVKAERVDTIGRLHLKNAEERNRSLVGKTVRVLYEDIDYDRNLFVGRTQQNAPGIDTVVYFKANFADVGHFYDVRITGYDGYDLTGEVIGYESAD